ncbi:MAG: holo-ACP synthase [Deltaproteobacteria bacterium]|nr:holo-ACP synthase [Deltaproteobacteria bacterium]
MIYGIGVDLVKTERMEEIISKWGDRFVKRVFTPLEREACSARAHPPSAFSLRFAAKEAFVKALGLGIEKGVTWQDIEIFSVPGGRPGLKLEGKSLEVCKDKGINGFHLSLSDEKEYGIAMVVLEMKNETGEGI